MKIRRFNLSDARRQRLGTQSSASNAKRSKQPLRPSAARRTRSNPWRQGAPEQGRLVQKTIFHRRPALASFFAPATSELFAFKEPKLKRPFHTCACGDHAFLEVAAKYVALVDPDDVPKLAQHKWCLSGANPPYASTTDRKKLAMHRVILEPARQQEVDHRNLWGLG